MEILHIPRLYIYSLMLFVVDNMHYCETYASIHEINTTNQNQLHILSVILSAIQRGATYSAIKIFNKLPPRISGLKNDKVVFKSAFRMFSVLYKNCYKVISSYLCLEEFFSLLISSSSSFMLTIFRLLYSYLLSAMFDPVFTLLSRQHILYMYSYLIFIYF